MSTPSPTLESLASTIVDKVAALSYQLGAQNIPKPSLNEEGHVGYTGESTELRKIRYDVASAAKTLMMLAMGPEDTAQSIMWSAIDSANMAVLLRFDFFNAVPLDGDIAAADLAAKVDLPLDTTERMIRFAIANGLFTEPDTGVFAHSATSAALAHTPELRTIGIFASGPLTSFVVRIADALDLQQAGRNGVKRTLTTGQDYLGPEDPAFCLAYPGYAGPWELTNANKEAAHLTHNFMRDQGRTSRMRIDHLVKSRDWAALGAVRVFDVGGSMGHASLALAGAMPDASFVVQDANQEALAQGRAHVEKDLPELAARITYQERDFFQPLPTATGTNSGKGDVFLLQWILHDWNDADSTRIIKALVPAMRPGARLLISEAVRPAPPARLANTLDDKLVLFQDMTMMATHNSKERSIAEFAKIVADADPRFRLVAVGATDGSYRSLLEFTFDDGVKNGDAVYSFFGALAPNST